MALACLTQLLGCGVQLGVGVAPPQGQRSARATFEVAGRLKLERGSGAYGALDASFSDPGPAATFMLREVALGAGYHFAWDWLALELGPRVGVGAPVNLSFAKRGLHTALDGTLLFRVWGRRSGPGYTVAALHVDLALNARAGVWARPFQAHTSELFDAQLGFGVRVALASDLTAARDTDWEAP